MSRKPRQKCRTKFCRRTVGPSEHSPWCSRCRRILWKEKHPLKYFFKKLRDRAKERKKPFDLTYAEYEEFARQTGYDKFRGKTKYSLTIHRIKNHLGYTRSNIAAVTLSLNARLQFAPLPAYLRAEMEDALRKSAPIVPITANGNPF